jgi:hypothetical protein
MVDSFSQGLQGVLEPRLRNKSQVAGEIRVKKTHTTQTNIIEPILFWYNKFGCVFWLHSSVYIDLLHRK